MMWGRYFQKMINPSYSANGGTNNYLQWWYVPEMRASPTLAGGIGGTNDTSNSVRAQHYASGSNYAYYDAGVTADAEL